MKKILYITNARIPTEKAHGRQIMKMCEAFARRGTEVKLVVPRRRNLIATDPFKHYGIPMHTFTIKKLPSLDVVRFGKIGFWIQHLSFLFFAIPYAIAARANVVYSRDIILCFVLSLARVHDVVFEDHEPIRHRRIYAFLLRHIPHKVIVAANLRVLYESLGVSVKGVCVAPNGVDLEEFNAVSPDSLLWSRKYDIGREKKIILYTGHFYRWKGMYTLLDSLRFMGKDIAIVCIGGTASDYAEAQCYIEEQKLHNVHLVSFLPHAEIVQHLKSADVLVLPNTAKEERSLRYTTPLKLFEYMASGVPIVASRIPSFELYLKDGRNAALCKPDDPEDLSLRIQEVLSDNARARTYARLAREQVAEHTWAARTCVIFSFMNAAKKIPRELTK